MPVYKVSLRMAHDGTWNSRRKWSTTFHVEASSPADAAAQMYIGWRDHLRGGTSADIFCYEIYATDGVEGVDSYVVESVSPGDQRGTFVNTAAGEKYLPQTCVTVTLAVPGSRPSRKFWRFGLREGNINGGESLTSDVITEVVEAFDGLINDTAIVLVDPDGQAVTAVSKLKLGTREFGRTAGADVPQPPAVG